MQAKAKHRQTKAKHARQRQNSAYKGKTDASQRQNSARQRQNSARQRQNRCQTKAKQRQTKAKQRQRQSKTDARQRQNRYKNKCWARALRSIGRYGLAHSIGESERLCHRFACCAGRLPSGHRSQKEICSKAVLRVMAKITSSWRTARLLREWMRSALRTGRGSGSLAPAACWRVSCGVRGRPWRPDAARG